MTFIKLCAQDDITLILIFYFPGILPAHMLTSGAQHKESSESEQIKTISTIIMNVVRHLIAEIGL